MNKFARFVRHGGALVLASAAPLASFAQEAPTVDTTTALAGVSAAQTAVLAVLAGMITMMALIWATKKVLRLFGR